MNLMMIEARKGKASLNDRVSKESADKLIEELRTLYGPAAVAQNLRIGEVVCSDDGALESVEIEINSPGGSVFDGMRIYGELREMAKRGVRVHTLATGMAASMGSVIFMAGDIREMRDGAQLMIHEASTIAMGDARDMQRTADLLESISNDIAGIYSERSGMDKKEIRDLMMAETWINKDQAEKYGFAANAKKSIDNAAAGAYHTPMSLLDRLKNPSAAESAERVTALETELQSAESFRVDAETKISDLENALQEAANELALMKGKIEEAEAKLPEVENRVSEQTTRAETAEAQVAELQGKLKEAEESANAKAIALLAQTGQSEPLQIETPNPQNGGGEKTMTREAFNALTPFAQMQFCKQGGKITA
jgi:ATP-dependent Clp protease protease subunit